VDSGNTVNVYAHEFGHIMGLDDSYEIGEDSALRRISVSYAEELRAA